MKKGLSISILASGVLILSFLITFSLITFFNDALLYSFSLENEFYSQNIESNTKKIFFIGSSFGARINGTLVNQELEDNNFQNFTFYNLGKTGKFVTQRGDEINSIIESRPHMILFDVSLPHYGYQVKKIEQKLNPIEDIKSAQLNEYEIQYWTEKYLKGKEKSDFYKDLPNPKFVTLKIIQEIMNDETKLYPKYPDKPFYEGPQGATKIKSKVELEKMASNSEFIDRYDRLKHYEGIPELIERFHNENIKVVIFIAPHSAEFLKKIPESKKQDFLTAMDVLAQENSVPIYNLLEKYENQPIWSNLDHISINPKSVEYSKDISEIVIKEILN